MRHFRRRASGVRQIVKSYKKVLNFLPASNPGGAFIEYTIATGTDGASSQQITNIDPVVPTGAILKYIEVQVATVNATASPSIINTVVQYTLPGQVAIDPVAVGGNNRRNQVLHMDIFSAGEGQNSNRIYKIKIPKRFQRLSEGMKWTFALRNSVTITFSMQIIYKFYQ